jgi:hypothetical protein
MGYTMPDIQTFRDRLPIVAKMVNVAFNGDRKDDEEHISFVVIAYDGGNDHEFKASMMSNITEQRELISLFLSFISEYPSPHSEPAGHA